MTQFSSPRRGRRSLFALALCLAALPLAGCSGSSPESAVKAFYNALADGDTATAKKYIDPEALNGPTGAMADAMLPKITGVIKNAGGIKSIDCTNSTVNGDQATVHVKLTLKNGETNEDDLHLVNKDGWKIKQG